MPQRNESAGQTLKGSDVIHRGPFRSDDAGCRSFRKARRRARWPAVRSLRLAGLGVASAGAGKDCCGASMEELSRVPGPRPRETLLLPTFPRIVSSSAAAEAFERVLSTRRELAWDRNRRRRRRRTLRSQVEKVDTGRARSKRERERASTSRSRWLWPRDARSEACS